MLTSKLAKKHLVWWFKSFNHLILWLYDWSYLVFWCSYMIHYHVTFHSMISSDLFQVKTPEYASVWSQQAETRVTFNGRMQWRWLRDYLKVYLLTSVKRYEIKIINWYDILKLKVATSLFHMLFILLFSCGWLYQKSI